MGLCVLEVRISTDSAQQKCYQKSTVPAVVLLGVRQQGHWL